jgi:signal transduction histidine kinase
LNLHSRTYTLRRVALAATAIGALVMALTATGAALQGAAEPGVIAEEPGGSVLSVSPTGFAWRYGVRPGQRVVAVSAADDPSGWSITTTDHGQTFFADSSTPSAGVRDSLAVAVASVLIAGIAVLLLRTNRRLVLPLAALALAAASTPLVLRGDLWLALGAPAAGAVVPAGWLALVTTRRSKALGLAGLTGLAVLLVATAAARLGGADAAEALESARGGVWLVAILALGADRTVLPRLRGESISMTRPTVFDVLAVAMAAGISLALIYWLRLPPLLVGGVLLTGMFVIAPLRQRLRARGQGFLLADVRQEAALEAAEAERARLARDLHDVPLQELTSAIRRVEVLPGSEMATDELRSVAAHLREMAVELRPPVLDDFGLPAALEYLASQTTSEALPVRVEIEGETGFLGSQRPPEEVELAIYRIAGEAVANAVRHAGARSIRITANVRPGHVDLAVIDDGRGIDAATGRNATARGHLGLASIRRRAQAIDAELSIDGTKEGTTVRASWYA